MKKTLFYGTLLFCGLATACTQDKQPQTATSENVAENSETSIANMIAMIDTVSIFAQYDMVADMLKELEAVEKKLMNDLQAQAKRFQDEYENYLKVGSTMTLSEQKKKEEQLGARQQQLQQLDVEKKILEQNQLEVKLADELLSKTLEKYNKLANSLETQKKEILNKAKSDAKKILDDANKLVEKTIRDIKEAGAEKQAERSYETASIPSSPDASCRNRPR